LGKQGHGTGFLNFSPKSFRGWTFLFENDKTKPNFGPYAEPARPGERLQLERQWTGFDNSLGRTPPGGNYVRLLRSLAPTDVKGSGEGSGLRVKPKTSYCFDEKFDIPGESNQIRMQIIIICLHNR